MVVPGGELRASLKGGDYVLNGRKSLWVSCGQVATHATLFVNIDASGLDRGGIAIVPLDLPGISRGEPMDKLGLRALPQGQLIFDNVRIPRRYMIVEPEQYKEVLHATHVGANVATALLAFGTGRAAYEGALKWTKERVQGGKVIYDHQATRLRLFRMFTQLEAARSMCRAVYKYNYAKLDAQEDGRIEHSCAAKVFTTDAAFEIADTAIQLCGDRGLDRHGVVYKDGTVFPAEKLLRDAKAYKIADGENTLLMLLGATQL
jgi:alkylation response protein AidB-like acyl-CoA dehydrogenase